MGQLGAVYVAWRAERTSEAKLAIGETVTIGDDSYFVHITDEERLQVMPDRSSSTAHTTMIAALERVFRGLFYLLLCRCCPSPSSRYYRVKIQINIKLYKPLQPILQFNVFHREYNYYSRKG